LGLAHEAIPRPPRSRSTAITAPFHEVEAEGRGDLEPVERRGRRLLHVRGTAERSCRLQMYSARVRGIVAARSRVPENGILDVKIG
jgi:hypothetical protein